MKTNDTRPRGRRQQRGGQRSHSRNDRPYENRDNRTATPKKTGFWQKLVAFFTRGKKEQPPQSRDGRADRDNARKSNGGDRPRRESRKPEPIEVTSPRLYVGNLSYDAVESDLFDLFKGVGEVQNAEIVTDRASYKSKGFGFVTMLTIDEAKRAVDTLHDKPFMGRSLVVTGSKSEGRHL